MTLTPVPIERIPYEWEAVLRLIEPAIAKSTATTWEVLHGLLDGSFALFRVADLGRGYLIGSSGLVRGEKTRAAWVVFVGGELFGGPRARIAAVAKIMGEFEGFARAAKCKQVRVETSRPWRLQGYAEIDRRGSTRIYRKVI